VADGGTGRRWRREIGQFNKNTGRKMDKCQAISLRIVDSRSDRSNKSNNYTYNEVKLILRSRYID